MKLFKKVLAMALALCMVLSCMGLGVVADDATTVSSAEELTAALSSASEITLDDDITLTAGFQIAAGEVIVLNLNGKTLSVNSSVAATDAAITNRGTLTINGGGKLTYRGNGDANFGYGTNTITNYGTLTVNSAIIENTTASGSSCAIDNNSTIGNVKVTLNDATVSSVKTAIREFANSSTYTNEVVINNSSVTGSYGVQAHLASGDSPAAKIEINNSTITATNTSYPFAIYSWAGGMSYEDVSISVSGDETKINGDIAVGAGSNNGVKGTGAEKVTISGGTVDGEIYTYNSKTEDDIKVTGGTFSSDVRAYVDGETATLVTSVDGITPTSMKVGAAAEADIAANGAKFVEVAQDGTSNGMYVTNAVANQLEKTEGVTINKIETIPPTVTTPSTPSYTEPSWTWDDEEEEEEIRYDVEEGKNQKYTQNSEEGLTFKFDASFRKFKSIRVDGKKVASKYYTAEKGSTIITLSPEYLDTLDSGKHTLKVLFSDGYAQVKFTVLEGAKVEASAPAADADKLNPSTGANDFVGAAVAMAVVSVAGVALLNKKR